MGGEWAGPRGCGLLILRACVCRVLWDRECGGSGSEGEEDENREELTTAAGTRDSDLLGPTMKR